MSTYNYNLQRVLSRVQNNCIYGFPSGTLTKKLASPAKTIYDERLIYKGNILQYKINSSQLTKKQKYTQLAKGLGQNRTNVFATQSQTYTNPNTTGLLRVNYDTFTFPNQLVGKPNNISGPYQYMISNPFYCSNNSIQDGGNLICGTYANPCTGEIIKKDPPNPLCYPTYFSDVPGRAIDLCWYPNIQTWFPRQRYFMNNSTNKFPQGYKGFISAIRPIAPTLKIDSYTNTSITLSWSEVNNNSCLPISSYHIHQDSVLINTVPYTTTNITISNLSSGTYTFYVIALSTNIPSLSSNNVSQTI